MEYDFEDSIKRYTQNLLSNDFIKNIDNLIQEELPSFKSALAENENGKLGVSFKYENEELVVAVQKEGIAVKEIIRLINEYSSTLNKLWISNTSVYMHNLDTPLGEENRPHLDKSLFNSTLVATRCLSKLIATVKSALGIGSVYFNDPQIQNMLDVELDYTVTTIETFLKMAVHTKSTEAVWVLGTIREEIKEFNQDELRSDWSRILVKDKERKVSLRKYLLDNYFSHTYKRFRRFQWDKDHTSYCEKVWTVLNYQV